MKKFTLVCLCVLAVAALYGWLVYSGVIAQRLGSGDVAQQGVPISVIHEREAAQRSAQASLVGQQSEDTLAKRMAAKQILFGDLHVHTTFSNDAFVMSLSAMQGEGVHPPADACDYARFCSGLDFWSINDHAISLDTQRWADTREFIRQCNAMADPDDPDVVAYLGFEWTQASDNAQTHWGHKNVIYRDVDDDKTPPRPIYARLPGMGPEAFNPPWYTRIVSPTSSLLYSGEYWYPVQHNRFMREMELMRDCPDDVRTNELPGDCREAAEDPATLFRKLDEGGYASIVIPHGNAWGLYTPSDSTWDKQLNAKQHDPDRQFLVEVMSGHGNSEEYRDWQAMEKDADGNRICPEPMANYMAVCWRAGEIIRKRCLALGNGDEVCDERAAEARANAAATEHPMRTVPGAMVEDWLAAGQCTDCFLPAYNYRPGGSSQYALAISNFDEPDAEAHQRFRFGFVASSDNHRARPGTGYKEYGRLKNTEVSGPMNATIESFVSDRGEPVPYSRPFSPAKNRQHDGFPRWERASSFLYTGGLVAVHAPARDRGAIWDAMQHKEVYGTSGDRILLWFDLLNGDDGEEPMGSESKQTETPRFRVRAVGAFEQLPGCPEHSASRLSGERLDQLCGGECYNPSDRRKLISRIEVVRIRPQQHADEAVGDLIEDVWKSHDCRPNLNGCQFEFDDPEFTTAGRDAVYYVRAIQELSLAVNGAQLRCDLDENGQCITSNPCHGSYRTDSEDDCPGEVEERAWSSPIFVDFGAADVVASQTISE